MDIQRRRFIAGVGVAAVAVPLVSCSQTTTKSDISSLPLTDTRVQDFLKYREEVRSDPAKAIKDYTSPGFVYTSSSGKRFDQNSLASRINDWVAGFTVTDYQPLWAASLGKDEILIATRATLVHEGQFRGQDATNKTIETESLFEVAFDNDGKIASYTRFADYGAIADALGTTSLSQLHGID